MTADEAGPLREVRARPIRTTHIANAAAAVALVLFVISAVYEGYVVHGTRWGVGDQVFAVILGLIIAGGLRLPTRPRLRADLDAVHTRGYLGNYRTIPWSVIVAVEFPRKVRFAQLRLPGDERLAVYAVQRMDRDRAVEAMRGLRTLFAMTHPAPGGRAGGPAQTGPGGPGPSGPAQGGSTG